MGWSRTRWFIQVLQDSKRRGKSWHKIEKDWLWGERRDWRLLVHQPIRTGNNARRRIILFFLCLYSKGTY
jgi:hypothetical protein